MLNFFFFFSSRRRHTRFSRDWSSDVSSSDLVSIRGPSCRSGSNRYISNALARRAPSGAGQILPVPILEFLGSPTFRRRALMSAPSISGMSHPGHELAELLHDPSVNADQFSTKPR